MADPIDIGVPGVSTENQTGAQEFITDMLATMDEIGKEWYVGQLWEWPEEFQEAKDKINEVAQWLLMILDLVATILEIAKAFILAYLNPIGTIVTAIIQEINDFLRDLQQWGIYVTWTGIQDASVWEYPFKKLLGGYQEFERTMIGKLTNRDDPTRPDVSYKTPTLAFFMYASVDISGIAKLIKLIQLICKMFSFQTTGDALPACGPPTASYGLASASPGMQFLTQAVDTAVSSGDVDLTVNLEWEIQRGAQFGGITLPMPPVQGFIIEVSIMKEGLPLYYNFTSNTAQTSDGTSGKELRKTLPLMADDGKQLVLYGGWDQLAQSSSTYAAQLSPGVNIKSGPDGPEATPGSFIVFGKRSPEDNQLIPLDLLRSKNGQKYYLQRTFIVGQEENAFVPGDTYRFVLNPKLFPYDATFDLNPGGGYTVTELEQPGNYYIRIRSTTDSVEEAENNTTKTPLDTNPYQYDFDKWFATVSGNDDKKFSSVVTLIPLDGGTNTLKMTAGRPSPVTMINNPNKNTAGFIEAVQTALAMLVLCRVDFQPIEQLLVNFKNGQNDANGYADKFTGNHISESRVDTENMLDPDEVKLLSEHKMKGMEAPSTWLAWGETHLEQFQREYQRVTGDEPDAFYVGEEPKSWSANLYDEVRWVSRVMYAIMGSQPALEKMVVDRTVKLRTMTMAELVGGKIPLSTVEGKLTILQFLNVSERESEGGDGWDALERNFFGGSPESFLKETDQMESFLQANPQAFEPQGYPFVSRDGEEIFISIGPKSSDIQKSMIEPDMKYLVESSAKITKLKRLPGGHEIEGQATASKGFYGLTPKSTSVGSTGGQDAIEEIITDPDIVEKEMALQAGFQGIAVIKDKFPTVYNEVKKRQAKETNESLKEALGERLKLYEEKRWYKSKKPVKGVTLFQPRIPVLGSQNAVNSAADPTFSPRVEKPTILDVRGLFNGQPQLYTEAQLALNVAAAAFNKYEGDGAWMSVRIGALPGIEDFMELINKWLAIINKAIQSLADFIIAYIDYVIARIREIQKFIRKLNQLIQSLTLFEIPKAACLLTLSDGTDGIVGDLLAAGNKPADGPRAYGAGGAIVVPTIPNGKFILELIMAIAEATKGDGGGEGGDSGVPEGES